MSQAVHNRIRYDLKDAIRAGITLLSGKLTEEKLLKALTHHEAIQPFFDESEPVYFRHFLCNLGLVHYEMGHHELAIEHFDKCFLLPVSSEPEKLDIAAVKVNKAHALMSLKRFDEAHKLLDEAAIYFTSIYDYANLGEVLETRARAFLGQGLRAEAKAAAQEAYDMLRWYSDEESARRAHRTLAICWEAK